MAAQREAGQLKRKGDAETDGDKEQQAVAFGLFNGEVEQGVRSGEGEGQVVEALEPLPLRCFEAAQRPIVGGGEEGGNEEGGQQPGFICGSEQVCAERDAVRAGGWVDVVKPGASAEMHHLPKHTVQKREDAGPDADVATEVKGDRETGGLQQPQRAEGEGDCDEQKRGIGSCKASTADGISVGPGDIEGGTKGGTEEKQRQVVAGKTDGCSRGPGGRHPASKPRREMEVWGQA